MINPTNHSSPLGRMDALSGSATQGKQAARGANVSDSTDKISIDRAMSLRQKLETLPVVRPEVVETGKQLAASPDYPPAEVVRQVAQSVLQSPDLTEAE